MATDYAIAMRLAQAVETITLEMGRLGVLVNVPVPEIPGNKDKGIATAIRLECIADFLERVNLELSAQAIAQQEAIKASYVTLEAIDPADVVAEPGLVRAGKVKK